VTLPPENSPPAAPVSPSRRRSRPVSVALWIIRFLGWCALLIAALGLAMFWYGRTVSDRLHTLQFLAWLPSWTVLWTCGVFLTFALLARVKARTEPLRARARRATRVMGIVFFATCLYVVLFEMHITRAIWPSPPAMPGAIRLVHWNQESISITKNVAPMRTDIGYAPDVLLISSHQPHAIFDQSLGTLGRDYNVQRHAGFVIASTFGILQSRVFQISLADGSREGTREHAVRKWMEDQWNNWAQALGLARREFPRGITAAVILIELDTRATLGRTTTLWWVDLPSDPFASRWGNAHVVRARIDQLTTTIDPATGSPLLPPADIVIGDFNTPRGSASLNVITGSLPHAFDLAGWGDARSFPRTYPIIHVDHTFVGPRLSVDQYELIRPSLGDHWLQSISLRAK
jgi:hypothetical protein